MSPEPGTHLRRIYGRRFDGQAAYRDRVWRTLIAGYFSRYIAPSDCVLDLGCGHGEFINNVPAGARYAMDLNPAASGLLREGITFLEQDCSAEWRVAAGSLDVVFTSNFLEHLPAKEAVLRTLEQARRCLRPGGRLIALGPNIRFTGGAYWDFWDHHVPLTERSLREALELLDFRCDLVLDRFLPYTMAGARQYPAALIAIYLRMPSLWPWFGRQFLVVATRV